jgi:hypothetical protein
MKSLLIAACCAFFVASANAGTLKKCEGVSTTAGYRYVGTYCVDFACSYVFTRMFTSYCPYQVEP